MRRITKWSLDEARRDSFFAGTKLTTIATRDYRLMRAVAKAMEKIANTPSPECARDPFLCKSFARQAMDAFNAPEKGK